MNLISKTKVHLQTDRDGVWEEYVQIEVYCVPESDLKRYRFDVQDYAIANKDTEFETKQALFDRNGAMVKKTYYKTYEEFDGMVEILAQMYPSELTGSELRDFYIVKGSLHQLLEVTVYNETEFERR